MWQKFTERARRVIFFAQEEAGKLNENSVSTEHLLLGLVREGDSIATDVLVRIGIPPDRVRSEIGQQVSRRDEKLGPDMQLSPRAKRVIDLASEESKGLSNNYIGTEHLLLGLIREKEGVAGKVLAKLGADLKRTRIEVRALQEGRDQDVREKSRDIVKALMGASEIIHPRTIVELKNTQALRGRSIMSIADLSSEEIDLVFAVTSLLKQTGRDGVAHHHSLLFGKTLAMIFEKPSLRTRVTFEVGMTQLGGHAIYLAPSDIQIGKRESVGDVGSNLSRWCDVIMARVFAHSTVKGLSDNSSIPVINGLSDLEHPCQALADFQTIREHRGNLKGLKLAFIGDGNNVANSLMLLAAKVGTNFTLACPKGYEPVRQVIGEARSIASETGSKIEFTHDPAEAADGADALYTDVWASMGQESEAAERKKVFAPYQINQALLDKAGLGAIVLHCLPAHRGDEITDDVIDGPQSVVLDEAENRLHAQKALLALIA